MSYQHVFGIGSLLTSGAGLFQASGQHDVSLQLEIQQHEQEIQMMKEQHKRELMVSRQSYLLSTYTDIEQYFQELNENLINGSRDAERDMVDQRNQQFQTILIAATMMLTSILSILYQGLLPEKCNPLFYVLYSVSIASSLLFLLGSIFMGIIITSRVNRFMYKRSQDNIEHLTVAMDQTKIMMRQIRGEVFSLVDSSRSRSSKSPHFNNGRPKLSTMRSNSGTEFPVRKELVSLEEAEVDDEWLKHEEEVYKYLERRNKINERMELLAVDLNNEYRVSFQNYWNEHCRNLGNVTLFFFYVGTALMLVATIVYMYAYFIESYKNNIAAVVPVVTIGTSLVLSLSLAIYLRYFDRTIQQMRNQIHSETEKEKKYRYHLISTLKGPISKLSSKQK